MRSDCPRHTGKITIRTGAFQFRLEACSGAKWESGKSNVVTLRTESWRMGGVVLIGVAVGRCKREDGPVFNNELPNCAGLRRGLGEANLASGLARVEEVLGQGLVAQGFEQQVGQHGEMGDSLNEIAPGQQLHQQMGDLKQVV